jgi:AraC-like DNA-binding protein
MDAVVCKKCGDTMLEGRKHTWCKECLTVYNRVLRAKQKLLGIEIKPRRSTRKAGEEHWNSGLTQTVVNDIRAMRRGGLKLKRIASYVGVSESQVCRICTGIAWRSE